MSKYILDSAPNIIEQDLMLMKVTTRTIWSITINKLKAFEYRYEIKN
jgi:hypothetical protein